MTKKAIGWPGITSPIARMYYFSKKKKLKQTTKNRWDLRDLLNLMKNEKPGIFFIVQLTEHQNANMPT